jgi:hypothetical protein
MNEMHHITRLDYARTHAWWVRFQRGPTGARTTYSKMFSDKRCGGKLKARRAAIRWRDENAPRFPKQHKPGSGRKPQPAGYSSLTRFVRSYRLVDNSTSQHRMLQVRFKMTKTTFRTRLISIDKWGNDGAEGLALQWLQARKRELKKRQQRRKAA